MSLFKSQSTMLSLCSLAPNSPKTLSSSTTPLPLPTTITRRRLLLFTLSISPSLTPLCSSALKTFDPVSPAERDASASLTRRISEAVELLERGRELQVQGDFVRALDSFSQVIKGYKDLALSEYARVGRALALYEVGDREEAIAELEDVSISLKGYPEVHAALAAALYADKHAPLLAENQFTIATLLDPRYSDLTYVRETKHWPPSLNWASFLHNNLNCEEAIQSDWFFVTNDKSGFILSYCKPSSLDMLNPDGFIGRCRLSVPLIKKSATASFWGAALLPAAPLHSATRGAVTEAKEQLLPWIGSNESYWTFHLHVLATIPVVKKLHGFDNVENC
ncbi:hypothetical protein Syun_014426 [Stephania yunnanensis]|uniref:Uncharacterized protein n=1 Tax=Stephania yunnanensis TaxID=152371 RepID=A0AAP0JJA8_9MAGN